MALSFEKQREEIILLCKNLLTASVVDAVVGFQEGGIEGMALPYIFSEPPEAEALVWHSRCIPHLSRYLIGRKGKTAIVAKPCDARAVVALAVEKQLKREDIHIIGLACDGMKDSESDGLPACVACKVNRPPVYDSMIDDPDVAAKTGTEKQPLPEGEERAHFEGELQKCILCFACRQACYACYCNTCFIERDVPNWQPTNPDKGTKRVYHMGRAMHLAGRCVACGACDNACASGVNLKYVIQELTDFVEEMYDYRAGMDLDKEPAMLTYENTDQEVGFWGGDAHD